MTLYNNWREEIRSAYLYAIVAEHEHNLVHKKLFLDLRSAALKQAETWEQKIIEQGLAPPSPFRPDFRTRLVAWLIKFFGTEAMHPILAAMKIRGMSLFTSYHNEHRHTSLSTS